MHRDDAICTADLGGCEWIPEFTCEACGMAVPAPGLCDDCQEALSSADTTAA